MIPRRRGWGGGWKPPDLRRILFRQPPDDVAAVSIVLDQGLHFGGFGGAD